MIKIIKYKTHYNPEEKQKDNVENNIPPPQPDNEVFKVAVEYSLDKDNLLVKIPVEEIKYPKDILVDFKIDDDEYVKDDKGLPVYDESGRKITMPINSIQFFKFFGSEEIDETGYIFVPDGSGAIITFDSRLKNTAPYSRKVYGRDNSLSLKNKKTKITKNIRLPLFFNYEPPNN